MARHTHLKCYARKLADCSTRISREHYVSHAVLRAIGASGPVLTKGLAWQEHGVEQFIPTDGLASNILCEAHNTRLSALDSEASLLFQFLQNFHAADRSAIPKSAEIDVDGAAIERWMLKSLCGFVAARTSPTHFPDKVQNQRPPDWWIDILFGLTPMPAPMGLHFYGGSPPAAEVKDFSSGLQYRPLEQEDIGVYGAIFNLYTPRFLLSLASPPQKSEGTLLEYSVRHPANLVLSDGEYVHRVNFRWFGGDAGRPITMTRLR